MIQFDELRITPDGKNLIIAAHVNTLDHYYKDLTIKELYINTEEERPDFGVVNKAAAIYKKDDFEEGTRSFEIKINCNETTLSDNSFSKHLLFVFIMTEGAPSECTPCGFNGQWSLGVTFDVKMLYDAAMTYIRELGQTCGIPKGFIDFILQFEALKVSVESENYPEAVKVFNKLFKTGYKMKPLNCGCGNGRSTL